METYESTGTDNKLKSKFYKYIKLHGEITMISLGEINLKNE